MNALPSLTTLTTIREAVIGDDRLISGVFGDRRIVYADYAASGRALSFIENVICQSVLPYYANTHSEASYTARHTHRLREEARSIIHTAVGARNENCVIFCGSGATGAIDKLIGILGIRIPSSFDDRVRLSRHIRSIERPLVLIGPFEHHSNVLPWRESIADVIELPTDHGGCIDVDRLDQELAQNSRRSLKIVSLPAASNVTGVLTNTCAVSDLVHRHGALAFWDFAAAAPYVRIDMNPRCSTHALGYMDAMWFSPHKFPGGPGSPGVLVVRRELLQNRVPDVVGGGTVAYVDPSEHRYLGDAVQREEGGTPEIIGSIRAGLAVQLKEAVGVDLIRTREASFSRRAATRWSRSDRIRLLGSRSGERLAIVSFTVRGRHRPCLHHGFVVTLLSDLYGIQARGGCSCAGPYGHILLGIDRAASRRYANAIENGYAGIKPGWTRVSFGYLMSEVTFEYVLCAVEAVATDGWRLLPSYRFDPWTGRWRHCDEPVTPPIRLGALSYDPGADVLRLPSGRQEFAPEAVLDGYLKEGAEILARATGSEYADDDLTQILGVEFEQLRWFDLPSTCVTELGGSGVPGR